MIFLPVFSENASWSLGYKSRERKISVETLNLLFCSLLFFLMRPDKFITLSHCKERSMDLDYDKNTSRWEISCR